MLLRLLRPALLTSVLLTVAVPHAAWAADAVLREPADAVVTGTSRLVVRVATSPEDRAERVEVGLHHLEGDLGPDARHELCDAPATCSRDRADYPIDFDPRTGAPFLAEDDARILPNGDYLLRVVVTRADDLGVETLDLPLTISAPGTAPAQVEAAAERDEVRLTWEPAPEPDVAGYLVERATGTGWSLIAEVPAEATALADLPGPGVHAYRVVTLRPDGRGATYETVSREVSVEVESDDDPPVAADQPARDGGATGGDVADPEPSSAPAVQVPGADTDGQAVADAPAGSVPAERGTETTVPASPAPGPSYTARTVTEDGELVLGSPDAGRQPASNTRLVAAVVVGAVFLGLAGSVWRRSRPVHRRPA